ncbi:uncharacterized protein DNG_08388 [Cephalotrichum gorgonifer]|uniref:Uncharacterized protein n=1 Tax=Cephalotrichum gorgonifer TaxID=2041049 RepID=A0AAE8SYB1_9PEZI|nr:uncharacterized protein DNG_08388 [Cephalotrichum gorgonifer]
MGIKGIYAELGPGRRVALAKLAADHLELTKRPLRLAIDISIWQFQIQAAKGGTNPAIRTLFYRLARLLSFGIEPVFVFDGPRKPLFKRNKRSIQGDRTSAALAKRLIDLFGFVSHDAPGEAEAECALLQRCGLVDAVLSEDVDTIMFGCTKTLRNWTSEGRGSKTPSHVSVYGVDDEGFRNSGLDREGMVLVALMSGGDYIPEGIPGCGPKVACEAARAGYGKSLCKLKRADTDGLEAWKRGLTEELRSNASGYFRTRHKALVIPESFPNLDVLRYYTHPVVSGTAAIDQLKAEGQWSRGVNMLGMRKFVEETFDWTYRIGADKLIRVLAPSLLVQKLMARYRQEHSIECEAEVAELEESALIQKISGRRAHVSTDGIAELRVQFVPSDIAGLDLSVEIEEEVASFGRDGLALNSDEEFEDAAENVAAPKNRFDPTRTDATWVLENILKLGAPLTVEDFEAGEREKLSRKKAPKSAGAAASRKKKAGPLQAETLDGWLTTTKPSTVPQSKTPSRSPSKSTAKLRDVSNVRSVDGADRARPEEELPASPRPKSKPKHASSSASALLSLPISQATPPRTITPRSAAAAGHWDPIFLSSSPVGPETAAADEAEHGYGAASPAPRPDTSREAALDSPPRLRLPSDPLDTPPWLKALCEKKKEDSSTGDTTPSRAGKTTKQGTLDVFVSTSAAGAAQPDPKGQQPQAKAVKAAKVHKGKGTAAIGSLFPITKKDRVVPTSRKEGGAGLTGAGAYSGGGARLFDPFADASNERGDVRFRREGHRESDVSVIDLTGDD